MSDRPTRRRFLATSAAGSFAAGAVARRALSAGAKRRKPNLLFLWTDEQRADLDQRDLAERAALEQRDRALVAAVQVGDPLGRVGVHRFQHATDDPGRPRDAAVRKVEAVVVGRREAQHAGSAAASRPLHPP